jgi:hypothetical protein
MGRQEEIDDAATAASTLGAPSWRRSTLPRDDRDPVSQRLCLVEGPAAFGFEDWWA